LICAAPLGRRRATANVHSRTVRAQRSFHQLRSVSRAAAGMAPGTAAQASAGSRVSDGNAHVTASAKWPVRFSLTWCFTGLPRFSWLHLPGLAGALRSNLEGFQTGQQQSPDEQPRPRQVNLGKRHLSLGVTAHRALPIRTHGAPPQERQIARSVTRFSGLAASSARSHPTCRHHSDTADVTHMSST